MSCKWTYTPLGCGFTTKHVLPTTNAEMSPEKSFLTGSLFPKMSKTSNELSERR
jgi:hypothetical protein